MPRSQRDLREMERLANAARWAVWLNSALNAAGKRPIDLANASDERISRALVSKWTNGKQAADVDFALLVAKLLDLNSVDALRAAGHEDTAAELVRLAQKVRVDPVGALVEQKLAAIEDDPYLYHLERLVARGHIPKEEGDRRRAVYLEDKRHDIETIVPEAYDAEVARIEAGNGSNGSPRRTAL